MIGNHAVCFPADQMEIGVFGDTVSKYVRKKQFPLPMPRRSYRMAKGILNRISRRAPVKFEPIQ